jgi:hypothetical protein
MLQIMSRFCLCPFSRTACVTQYATFAPHYYQRSYISMFLFTYSSSASIVVQSLNCVDIGPFKFLQSIPSISCRSSFYETLQPLLIIWLIVAVIGTPLAIAIFILYHRHQILGVTPSITAPPLSSQYQWSILYESFHSRRWYAIIWSIILLVRRATLVALLQVPLGQVQSSLIALLSSISLLIHLIVQPYRSIIFNKMETLALTCHLLLAIAMTSDQLPFTPLLKIIVFIIVTIPTFILFGIAAYLKYSEWRYPTKQMAVPPSPSSQLDIDTNNNDDNVGTGDAKCLNDIKSSDMLPFYDGMDHDNYRRLSANT